MDKELTHEWIRYGGNPTREKKDEPGLFLMMQMLGIMMFIGMVIGDACHALRMTRLRLWKSCEENLLDENLPRTMQRKFERG